MRFSIAVSWIVMIAILHAIPGRDIASYSWLDFFQLDKLIHAIVFLVGIFLWHWSYSKQYFEQYRRWVVVGFLCYGILLELLQGYIFLERSADILDFLADAIGVFLGMKLFQKYLRMNTEY